MEPGSILRSYYDNAPEINAMTARRPATFEEKVKLAKIIGDYIKGKDEPIRHT